jgi:hypothetical protein
METKDKMAQDSKHPNKGSSAPPKNDPSGRPLTEDEKIDEAIRESFGASDAPAYSGSTGVGSPKDKNRKEHK